MKVRALGEFGLIARLADIVSRPSPGLLVGIGDDAAVWAPTPTLDVATTDILIEEIHFTLDTATWHELGWKAMAVNLSDLAAMGAQPRYALLSLALPLSVEVAAVEELYRGAAAAGDRFGMVIAGGDTVRSPGSVVINVSAFGSAIEVMGQYRVLRRNAARPGDVVAVTGSLGRSAAGLAMLLHGLSVPEQAAQELRQAHFMPIPRVPEAQVLLRSGVGAGMDISDGLAGDLGKLCAASGVAAVIALAKVPVAPVLRRAFPDRALDFALYGGEDYELLFCAPQPVFEAANTSLSDQRLAPATAIGEIVAGPAAKVWLRNEDGGLIEATRGGYDAFRGAAG